MRRRGTIRTAPIAEVLRVRRARRLADRELPPSSYFVNLEIEADAHAGIACWSGGPTKWAHVTVASAYDQGYGQVRRKMTAPVSKRAVVAIAAEMARFADRSTGRNCRPSVATLAARTGFAERTVQRARECLRLLGLATEVVRGRQRTYVERMASWRMGDRHRGWASVWALHDNPQVNRVIHMLTPHLARSLPKTSSSPLKKLVTTHAGAGGARQGVATRRRGIDQKGEQLARQWRAHPKAPSWAGRFSTAAWAAILAAPARAGWTADDLNAAVTEWLAGGHHIPDSPRRPIGLVGAVLAAYTAHNDLEVRPMAYAEAAAAAEAAQRAQQALQREVDRQDSARRRQEALEALNGPGHAEYRAFREAFKLKRRRWS
ncbi:hypothetical protein MMAD_56560 (plasmid) [Mycolicibacterium madagascariense]|uniref:Replication protein Rep n=2 Tax=Mycolicibacterium madagascariense TaxID=212765 RepID=A0A7I7XQ46_9MYCO|nr:hypothetical protein MMAD_56560 [Mycolicibacterium madagascariense]